jgi:hypothetical protein
MSSAAAPGLHLSLTYLKPHKSKSRRYNERRRRCRLQRVLGAAIDELSIPEAFFYIDVEQFSLSNIEYAVECRVFWEAARLVQMLT